jgi:hypothetical protein
MGERGKRGKRKRMTRGFRSIPYLPRGRIEVIEFCGGSCNGGSVHLFWATQYYFCVCVLQGVRAGLWGSGVKVRRGLGTHGYRGGGAGQGLRRQPALVVAALVQVAFSWAEQGGAQGWAGVCTGGMATLC